MSDLLLKDFKPACELVVPQHPIQRPKFPVIDFHVHYSRKTHAEMTTIFAKHDAAGVVGCVNLVGREARR